MVYVILSYNTNQLAFGGITGEHRNKKKDIFFASTSIKKYIYEKKN